MVEAGDTLGKVKIQLAKSPNHTGSIYYDATHKRRCFTNVPECLCRSGQSDLVNTSNQRTQYVASNPDT